MSSAIPDSGIIEKDVIKSEVSDERSERSEPPLQLAETNRMTWEDRVKAVLANGTRGRIEALLANKDACIDLETVLCDAATLAPDVYELYRVRLAKRLGFRPSVLDEQVKKRRPREEASVAADESEVEKIEPWPEPVNGRFLLARIRRFYQRYVVFPRETDAGTLALWAVGTHCLDLFHVFPRLGITSPEGECGKSRVLEITEQLVRAPQLFANLTTAVAFRIIEELQPTLLIEEFENFIQRNAELLGILNAGHKKGAFVARVEEEADEHGKRRFKTRRYRCFAPVMFHIIGTDLPGTFKSRTIFIPLVRRKPTEPVQDLAIDENPLILLELNQLRRQIVRWVINNQEAIRNASIDTANLANRARDNWKPLLKIAKVVDGDCSVRWSERTLEAAIAGESWSERALEAANVPPVAKRESDQTRLLRDIRNVFHSRPKLDRLPTSVLVADLLLQKESGWYRYHHNREPLDERDLARLLADYGIKPKAIYLNSDLQSDLFGKTGDDRIQLRGYERRWFTEAVERFLAEEYPEEVEVSPKGDIAF